MKTHESYTVLTHIHEPVCEALPLATDRVLLGGGSGSDGGGGPKDVAHVVWATSGLGC